MIYVKKNPNKQVKNVCMLSGFIFFRKVHISLVKLILEKVTRYQDQSLRKNLLPAHVSSFFKANKRKA